MLEKIVERFCDSPTQYRYLLQTEKMVEKRALEGKNDLSNMSLAITCVFGFIISVLFTFYAVHSFHGHIHLRAYGHNYVYDDGRHLDHPVLRYPAESYKLSRYCTYTGVIENLLSREVNARVLTYTLLLLASLKPVARLRWYPNPCWGIFSSPILFSVCIPTYCFYVGSFHNWGDDDFRGVFDKTLYQKGTPKYRAIRAVYIPVPLPCGMYPASSSITRFHKGSNDLGSEMVLRASERLVCWGSLARTRTNRTAFSDFSRTGCRFNALFGVGPASEYRKELFRISLLPIRVWQSAKI